MTRNKDISDVVGSVSKSRHFYNSLTSRERSLIKVCGEVEAYQGSYERMIAYLKQQYERIRNHLTAQEIVSDIQSLRKIKEFEEKHNVSFYCYPGLC